MRKSVSFDAIRKFWSYLGIILMLTLSFGSFLNDLKIPKKAQANAATTWTKSGSNPVVNSNSAGYPRVIKDGDTYKMWVEENGSGIIRYSTSSDGITWNAFQIAKDENTDNLSTHEITIIKDGGTYKMWANEVTSTKYRTSADGINWSAETTVSFDVTKAWDNDRITPFVFKDDSTYKMYYNANEGAGKYYIAYATSSDGLNWTEPQNLGQIQSAIGTTNNNLVLKQGSAGAWDGFQGAGFDNEALYQVHVLKNTGGTYEMWYGGNKNGWDTSPFYKIGYATSPDGITWTKSGNNPVLTAGEGIAWDASGVFYPTVIEVGSTYKMWYTKGDWTGNIGYATALAENIAPQTASVTTPVASTYYKASNIPAAFSGQTADGTGGTGLDANSTTFYIERTSDNHYWDGNDWDATTTQWLATTHSATADNSAVTWTSDSTLPTWSSGETYTSAAKATNKTSQTYTGSEITYYYDSEAPVTATVSSPNNGSTYTPETMPATFAGYLGDGSSGFGVNANSTTFYLKNGSDQYWTGSEWSGTETWLTTTHSATVVGGSTDWTDAITLPSWSNGTYSVKAKALDKADNTFEGTAISFSYSSTGAEISYSMDKFYDVYNSSSCPDSISGTATGTNIDHVYIKIYRYTDGYYWNGATWAAADPGWLNATGTTSWSYPIVHTNFENATSYRISAYAHDDNGDGATNISLFMYNSLDWTQYRINPLAGGNYFYNSYTLYPSILKDGDTYKMWYNFGGEIHYATSTNGINWSYSSFNAVLAGTAGSWDSDSVWWPWVVKDGDTYKMWYSGTNSDTSHQKIGYATSTDGITWTKSGLNPIMSPGASGQWDDYTVMRPMVIKDGSNYKMWYNGTRSKDSLYEIGYAASSDGTSWTKSGSNPVLTRGAGDKWDYSNIWGMSVIKRGDGQYEIYYSGNAATGGTGHQIGYAYSATGEVWFKYSSNPIMGPGSSGSWNDKYVYSPFIMTETSGDDIFYKMWYNGQKSDDSIKMGYATMDAPTDITKPASTPRFDLNETDPFSVLTEGSMHLVESTYWSGPNIWYDDDSLRGDASDAWGMEKVELTLQGSDGKYWDGNSWENEAAWLTSSTTDGFVRWNYTIDKDNFTSNRTYTLTSKATDGSASANVQVELGSQSFKWDSEDPLTTISTTVNDYVNSAGVPTAFSGTASDGVSGLQKILSAYLRLSEDEETIDAWNHATKQWVNIEEVIEWEDINDYLYALAGTSSWTYTPSTELQNSIKSASDGTTFLFLGDAIDNAYNVTNDDLENYVTYTVDNTAPNSTPTLTRLHYSSGNWPGAVSGTASDATSGVTSVSVRIKNTTGNTWWSGTDWTGNENSWVSASGKENWSYNISAGNLTDTKSYTVYSRATDEASNVQTSFGSDSFTYQTTGPSAPTVYDGTITGQETSEVESLTTLSANWTAVTDSISGIDHYEYAIGTSPDGSDIVSWTSTGLDKFVTKTGLNLSVDQTYYVSAKAVNGADIAGTHGYSSGQTVVDHTPPVVSFATYPSDPTKATTPTFTGTSIDAMTNISKIEFKTDDGLWTQIAESYSSKSVDFGFSTSLLSSGRHSVYVRSTDSKNNTSSPISYSFTVDIDAPSAPAITYPADGEIITESRPTIKGTAEANSTIFLRVYSAVKSYTTTVDSSGVWSYQIPQDSALDSGKHTIEAKAQDQAGNISSVASVSFTVQTTPAPVKAAASTLGTILSTAEKQKLPGAAVIAENITIPIISQNQKIEVLGNTNFSINITPSLNQDVESVKANFDNKVYPLTKQSDGSYSSNILSPAQVGTYETRVIVAYKNGQTEEVNVIIMVDPYGYIYEKTKSGEQHLAGAKVTLYVYKDGAWVVWDGANYSNQKNPVTTSDNGEYGFMVPPGKYYLTAEKDGYISYKSGELSIEQGKPISLNIELHKPANYLWFYLIIAVLFIAGIAYYYQNNKKSAGSATKK